MTKQLGGYLRNRIFFLTWPEKVTVFKWPDIYLML